MQESFIYHGHNCWNCRKTWYEPSVSSHVTCPKCRAARKDAGPVYETIFHAVKNLNNNDAINLLTVVRRHCDSMIEELQALAESEPEQRNLLIDCAME